jgi:hypothetical protein
LSDRAVSIARIAAISTLCSSSATSRRISAREIAAHDAEQNLRRTAV